MDISAGLTVVITPRERWGLAPRSLAATIDALPAGVAIVYVDGGSPPDVAADLEHQTAAVGGIYIRRDCVLTPHEARNLALPHLDRDYVVIQDDDVFPRPGYAEALVNCAAETGAELVGPLIFHGATTEADEIHFAGGDLHVTDGVMDRNTHHHGHAKLGDLTEPLTREPTEQLEYHCILMRRATLERLGPFDEAIIGMGGHEDLALAVRRDGGAIYVEPAAEVVYLLMNTVDRREWGYWQLRWSNDWNRSSLDHFCDKWNLDRDAGWPRWAEPWGLRQRSWMYHRHGRALTWYGKGLRFASRARPTGRLAGRFDELLNRAGRAELERRRAVLGHS